MHKRLAELKERAGTAWRVLRATDEGLVRHAKRELQAMGFYNGDAMNAAMAAGLIEIVRLFSAQGHSGFSAAFATQRIGKLLAYEPLGPLTGEPSEWNEVGHGVFQNNRCSHVFKQADRFDGKPYDIEGRIFREPSGVCFTSSESFVPVNFPYTPKREYVDVPANSGACDLSNDTGREACQ